MNRRLDELQEAVFRAAAVGMRRRGPAKQAV